MKDGRAVFELHCKRLGLNEGRRSERPDTFCRPIPQGALLEALSEYPSVKNGTTVGRPDI